MTTIDLKIINIISMVIVIIAMFAISEQHFLIAFFCAIPCIISTILATKTQTIFNTIIAVMWFINTVLYVL